jgi:hypothetical protein
MFRAIGCLLALILLFASPVAAKPAGSPLCFRDGVYDALWVLDTIQVGQRHWSIAGHVDYGIGYFVSVTGSGYTTASGRAGASIHTDIYGASVYANLNFNSEAIWWPNANIHFFIYFTVYEEGETWGTVNGTYTYGPITKVPCP